MKISHFVLRATERKWLKMMSLSFLVLLFFTMHAFSQLTNSYQLHLVEDCGGASGTEIGVPYVNVGVKLQPYNPQIGGPQKPHPTAQPTQFSDQFGNVFLNNLSCVTKSFTVHFQISGVWLDYYSIIEVDCTDGQPSYFNVVKLPDNYTIREWVSCDQGTRFIPNGPFGRDVHCDEMKIHIPNQFFSNAGDNHEIILEVNRVNRNTGQVSHLTTFSFISSDDPSQKPMLAGGNENLGIENCSSGSSNLFIDFHKVMDNAIKNSSIGCNQLLNLDVSLGIKCTDPTSIPVWHLGWVNYTVNNIVEGFDFDFTATTIVDGYNIPPYQNGSSSDGLLNNVDTDPNGTGQGPILGDNSAGIEIEVDQNKLNCLQRVLVYLYKYESCTAPWDPQNSLVPPGPNRSNPIDITNQFSSSNQFANVAFSSDIVGGLLDQESCYYVEVVVQNTCGRTYTTGGRFNVTNNCSFCRRISKSPTSVKVYPTVVNGNSEINVSFDHKTLTDGKVLIFDMKGLKHSDQKLPKQTKTAQVNLSNLTPGTYMTQIIVDGIYQTTRIVVQ